MKNGRLKQNPVKWKRKKSTSPAVKISTWENIIFNRAYEDVGEQRIIALRSKANFGKFVHPKGYDVYWTKFKFDNKDLPYGYQDHFLDIEIDFSQKE